VSAPSSPAQQPEALITGATGFIGQHLACHLAAEGWRLRLLVRRTSDVAPLHGLGARWVEGDVLDPASLDRAVDGVEVVFHLAAQTATRFASDACNVGGTRNLAEAVLRKAPALRRFVFVSSILAAGPTRSDAPLREGDPERPRTRYGASKLAAERALLRCAERLPAAIVRPPIVYGEGDRELAGVFRGLARGRMLLPGHGSDPISPIYVGNLVEALRLAAVRDAARGEVFYATDDRILTKLELLAQIARMYGHSPRPLRIPRFVGDGLCALGRRGSPALEAAGSLFERNWSCSMEKARRLLGYRPRFSLEEGLARTLRAFGGAAS
jgi:nucleoside-diphosphate-sugar epimerase